jgi:probable rRNA maturation factor
MRSMVEGYPRPSSITTADTPPSGSAGHLPLQGRICEMITVETDADEVWDSSTDWSALADRAVQSAARHSDHAGLAETELRIEVSVRFTSDEEVRGLNAAWRGKDKPTNVLSFPMIRPEELDALPPAGESLLGDIVLAHGVCAAEAADKGVSTETHAAHLIVHGMLHLLGYDHETGDEDADVMETIERDALASLGIADPYAIREAQS